MVFILIISSLSVSAAQRCMDISNPSNNSADFIIFDTGEGSPTTYDRFETGCVSYNGTFAYSANASIQMYNDGACANNFLEKAVPTASQNNITCEFRIYAPDNGGTVGYFYTKGINTAPYMRVEHGDNDIDIYTPGANKVQATLDNTWHKSVPSELLAVILIL